MVDGKFVCPKSRQDSVALFRNLPCEPGLSSKAKIRIAAEASLPDYFRVADLELSYFVRSMGVF